MSKFDNIPEQENTEIIFRADSAHLIRQILS